MPDQTPTELAAQMREMVDRVDALDDEPGPVPDPDPAPDPRAALV